MYIEGFIKISRKIMDWEWYTDINTKTLFLHCLLKANFRTKKYQGNTVKKGSFITSIGSLSKETGLTVQQTRTALKHLISTGELTSKSTNKNSIITMVNYDKYQDISKQSNKLSTSSRQTSDKRSASRQQTNDKQLTTVEERKNVYISPSEIYRHEEVQEAAAPDAADCGTGLPGKKMKWSFGDVKEFAKTVPGGDDYNACDFRRGFVKSGTAFPDNWKDVFIRFAAAGIEVQDEFLEKLKAGAYREKWGAGQWE